jgi:LysM repeat protein
MKLTKIFGIVLSLHVGVILLVMFQPGCQTADRKKPVDTAESEDKSILNQGAFNEGLTDNEKEKETVPVVPELQEPTRPVVGELFVPGDNDEIVPSPLPSVVDPEPESSTRFGLRPANVTIYKIQKGDTLWGVARKMNITLSSLLASNPSLSKNSRLKIGQEIMIPEESANAPALSDKSVAQPVEYPKAELTNSAGNYTVKSGDSLSKIARIHGVSLQSLMSVNGMTSASIIRPGQVLILPSGVGPVANPTVPSLVVPNGTSTYTVKKGDNLTRIATIYGSTVKEIMEWNNLVDAGKIRVGQLLIVSNVPASTIFEKEESKVISIEEDTKVEDFFKSEVEERPIIDVPDQP